METSGNKKSRKGRNKWINKLILNTSHNREGASLNSEEKKVVNSKGPKFTQPERRPITILRRPVQPKPTTTPQGAEPIPKSMAESELTVTAEQQPASLIEGPSMEAHCEQTNQALFMINSKGPQFTQPERRAITILRRPVEPKPTTTPHRAEPIPKSMAEPELTVTAEQQPASLIQGPSMEAYCEQTNQALLMIPELELHQLAGEKEEQVSKLTEENKALLKEVNRLKISLEKETKDTDLQNGFLKAELSKQRKTKTEAFHKIGQLEKALEAEKEHNKEMEEVLARQTDKMFIIEVNLAEVNVDLRYQRNQWEEEKSRLLAEQQDEMSILMAALKKAKDDLEDERRQWKEEKTLLLESLQNNKKTLEEKEVARGGSMETMSDQETQNNEIQEPKKTKKRSLRKRFLQLFK